MQTPKIQSTEENVIITIDKSTVDNDTIIEILRLLEVEHLAKEVNFDRGILDVGKEIKRDWWKENEQRLSSGTNR